MIVQCPSCAKSATVPDNAAGKKAACPHCKRPFVVPSTVAVESTVAFQPPPGASKPVAPAPPPQRNAPPIRRGSPVLLVFGGAGVLFLCLIAGTVSLLVALTGTKQEQQKVAQVADQGEPKEQRDKQARDGDKKDVTDEAKKNEGQKEAKEVKEVKEKKAEKPAPFKISNGPKAITFREKFSTYASEAKSLCRAIESGASFVAYKRNRDKADDAFIRVAVPPKQARDLFSAYTLAKWSQAQIDLGERYFGFILEFRRLKANKEADRMVRTVKAHGVAVDKAVDLAEEILAGRNPDDAIAFMLEQNQILENLAKSKD